MEENEVKLQFCVGCLCKNDNLKAYILQNDALEVIIQSNQLNLCFICKRIAERMESFIQSVQGNQLLLETIHLMSKSPEQSIPSRPIIKLSQRKLELLEFNPEENIKEEESFSLVHSYGTVTAECRRIKEELKIEDQDAIGQLDEHFFDDDHDFAETLDKPRKGKRKNDFLIEILDGKELLKRHGHYYNIDENNDGVWNCIDGTCTGSVTTDRKRKKVVSKNKHTCEPYLIELQKSIKEEDQPLMKTLIKKEVVGVDIDLKRIKKVLKKNKKSIKPKRKRKEISDSLLKVETMTITREECLIERAKKAAENIQYANSTYKCEDCIKGFIYKDSYDAHMKRHDESAGKYQCDICKLRMRTRDKLQVHELYHVNRYRCCICGLVRISRVTIQDHYSAVHGQGQYACNRCDKVYKRKVSLRKHLWRHANPKRVQCEYCLKTYAAKDSLKTHKIMMHPKEVSVAVTSYTCPECGKSFKKAGILKGHLKLHTTTSRDYYCVECDKSFRTKFGLTQHLKTTLKHVNYLELPYQCHHCDKKFAGKRDVARHMNRVHLNIKPFQCDMCEKAYINAWSLTEHKKYTHEGYKRPLKFPCTMCDKVFDRNQILKSHIRTHTGERPYQCSKCPAQFGQRSALGTHIKLIHLKLTRDGRPKSVAMK